MVAGDTSALEKIKEESPVEGDGKLQSGPPETGEKEITTDKKMVTGKKALRVSGYEEYAELFLKIQLTGTRRQTYIHDSLYRVIAEVLPVIAPDMSVPTFVNNVLSDHLERYQDVINEMYNRKATKKPVQWKK
ncbi:conjugative transposon protein TraB [Bacteroides reticulotermitis JCM 10512]|uniref:Conjugative transposon protein TraB n=2 Tax=Bacteroides reticulotermitis TaxID=1133319 RepID=W4UUJ5_9BACE|nr:conjugative transposon protein TraB [Bacteroides reticulotermitis JCM 10512]